MKGGGVLDQLIGGQDQHGGLRVPRRHQADPEGNRRPGVAPGGFCEDILGGQGGGQLAHGFFLEGVGEDENVLTGDQSLKAIEGLVEQRIGSEEIEELLWFCVSAEGPEAGAAAARQDHGI